MKINEVTTSQINDKWFEQGSFKTFKKPAKEKYEIAQQAGTVQTLEGPVIFTLGVGLTATLNWKGLPIQPSVLVWTW